MAKGIRPQNLIFVALGLTVPSATALADYYVVLPTGILMVIYRVPFFETVFWWAPAIACIGYLLCSCFCNFS